jgi:hypothetical protein
MSNKKYTLIFFVTGSGVAAGVLVCFKHAPVTAPITNIKMPDKPPLWFKGDLTLNGTTYKISGNAVPEKKGKVNQLKVTTTVPVGPFKMNDKQFDRVIVVA